MLGAHIFTERLWRSVKYEEVYLNDDASPRQARAGLARYFHFYNFERPHQALDYQAPAQVYAVKDQTMLYSTLERSPPYRNLFSCLNNLYHPNNPNLFFYLTNSVKSHENTETPLVKSDRLSIFE